MHIKRALMLNFSDKSFLSLLWGSNIVTPPRFWSLCDGRIHSWSLRLFVLCVVKTFRLKTSILHRFLTLLSAQKQSCKNVPTVPLPTSRCYFFWPVLIFGKSTRKTVLFCVFFGVFFGANFFGGKIGRCLFLRLLQLWV